METKSETRLRIVSARPHSSLGLTEQLIELVLTTKPKTIASYSPLSTEPDVSGFNNWAIQNGYQLALPKIVDQDLVFAQGELAKGSFSIQEPIAFSQDLRTFDLMLLPALAVDHQGFRLGKGKGFYDRVLFRARPTHVFAVIFDTEYLPALETEPHDQKVDGFVTPIRQARIGD
ncbi:5-formyltetrahydrofolate cyclo-ligase [Candidatus Aquiluna sp. UB-MaderosW2red]|uniref:5-formyltetrahydrofolate cyclo-ligase n=1 Tax=Candidatus Aquiluna sp. UB-MaderosW2red TaxID=1855377 RepID=UPI000875C4D5|nr:5-formyltetrahydrofolate cyclo-ligase [Candidatus Aquiluna sp. UB-MaderosW2red]SCX08609.1 5-formyltetrahydrofolate cyclo-ligase [Candidatus Aquiluna sp. UB-MaderosW2red]